MNLSQPEAAVPTWHFGTRLPRVKQLMSRTGRLYANTTIKGTRNRLLLICWKPQLSPLLNGPLEAHGSECLWQKGGLGSERQAAAVPVHPVGQMLGPVPYTVYTERRSPANQGRDLDL